MGGCLLLDVPGKPTCLAANQRKNTINKNHYSMVFQYFIVYDTLRI